MFQCHSAFVVLAEQNNSVGQPEVKVTGGLILEPDTTRETMPFRKRKTSNPSQF